MTLERAIAPLEADERVTLTAFLDFQRATLALKCAGLTDDQLRERAVPLAPTAAPPQSVRLRNASTAWAVSVRTSLITSRP